MFDMNNMNVEVVCPVREVYIRGRDRHTVRRLVMHEHPQFVALHAKLLLDSTISLRLDRLEEWEMSRREIAERLDRPGADDDGEVLRVVVTCSRSRLMETYKRRHGGLVPLEIRNEHKTHLVIRITEQDPLHLHPPLKYVIHPISITSDQSRA